MLPYALDWLNLLVRWFHFVAGIMWIGASFFFIWLDNHLVKPEKTADAANGVSGELWSVHGGGFYHNQKYLTGPKSEPLTLDLHWFKWEAYLTWISGMAMLAIIYWVGASTFLIDPSVMALTPATAITISIASIVLGWFIYDGLCRWLGSNPRLLVVAIAIFLLAADWGLFHIFGARAAYIHVGAIIGTMMVANVLFVIIPGQRKMLDQIRAGQEPDPRPGQLGKIRSVHNTYLTLPVLFIMISNHYPMTYQNQNGWLVLAAIAVAGVLVRQFFILSDKHKLVWGLPTAALVILIVTAFAIAPHQSAAAANAPIVPFATAQAIVSQRCAVCHAAHPTQAGFVTAPAGILLDTPENIAKNAQLIKTNAIDQHAMPLGNVTHMTDAERATLAAWIAQGAKTQ